MSNGRGPRVVHKGMGRAATPGDPGKRKRPPPLQGTNPLTVVRPQPAPNRYESVTAEDSARGALFLPLARVESTPFWG